jgi:GAF domain-containing protein
MAMATSGHELPTWAPLPARADPAFDELARRTAVELRAQRVLVVLVSKSGQVYPGAHGLPEPWNARRSMPLSHSMSAQVAGDGRPMVVRDAREHPELRDRFAVRDMGVVGFAAMPLEDVHGRPVGVLSVGDDRPREWTADELDALERLAGEASLTLQVRALQLAEQESQAAAERAVAGARTAAQDASTALVAAEAEADRARLVARLSTELLPAATIQAVLRAVDRFARSPLGASLALLGLAHAGCAEVDVHTASAPGPRPVAVLPLTAAHPLVAAVREHRVVAVRSGAEGAAQFAGEGQLPVATVETSLSVPLELGQFAATGGLLLGWRQGRELDTGLSAVVIDVGRHVGLALDRVLLRDQRLRLDVSAGARVAG